MVEINNSYGSIYKNLQLIVAKENKMTKLANRVISIFDRKTSMRLAVPEWTALDDICKREHIKRKKLFELIEENKDPKLGLTSSVRLFVITYCHNLIFGSAGKIKLAKAEYENIFKTIETMS